MDEIKENENNNNKINDSLNSSYISSSSSEDQDNEEINNDYDDYQGPYTSPSEDAINQEILLKDNNIIKIIKEKGDSLYTPKETYDVIIKCNCYYINKDKDSDEKIYLKNFCEFDGLKELNLEEKKIPRSLALCIESMRINEISLFKIKFNYIFRYLDTDKKNEMFYTNNIKNIELFDETFRKKYLNEKIFFEVKLINYYRIVNITKNGEIKKKIIYQREINDNKNIKPSESDIITFNIKCEYNNVIIYEYNNKILELDKAYNNKEIFDIELFLIKNSKLFEKNIFLVKYDYIEQKHKKFLEQNPLFLKSNLIENNNNNNNNHIVKFNLEILNIEHYDYIFKYKTANNLYSKSKILHEGFGLACPDEEMFVKFKLQIKFDGIIKYNNFINYENIEKNYISEKNEMLYEVINWRKKMDEEYDIKYLDQEIDYIKSEKIFEKLNFDNLISMDMNDYCFPAVIRKALCTMKRNEIKYIKCDYIDYMKYDEFELYNIKNSNIEMYLHLYDFREMPLFGKYSYEDKLRIISHYKEIADENFKKHITTLNEGNLFRAMKIYNKLVHRFSGGDVFGHDREAAEDYLKSINKELYDKLFNIRINLYNNLSVTLLKLGKNKSCYNISKQLLDLFDKNNIKALYLFGKSCYNLKLYEEEINIFKKIKELKPDNEDVNKDLKLAEEKLKDNINIQNNLYKKMFRGNN